jgi:hypothetical protein
MNRLKDATEAQEPYKGVLQEVIDSSFQKIVS